VTLIATYLERRDGTAESHCSAGDDAPSVVADMIEHLRAHAARGPIKLDAVLSRAALPSSSMVASLAVRPGLDGVCQRLPPGDCLMPWTLVANDLLTEHPLLDAVPDAKLGVSLASLRGRVGAGALDRVETKSWLLDASGDLRPALRAQRTVTEVSADTLSAASSAAQRYVQGAQHDNGRFRYVVDPYVGTVEYEPFSIARQAGTTMALCELGEASARRTQVVERSLALLASLEHQVARPDGEPLGVMRYPANQPAGPARFGPTALTLAALLRCRPLLGERYDELDARLMRTLLELQRQDGGFHPDIDVATGRGSAGGSSLFADGQAVLALVLAEASAADQPGWPPRATLRAAVERAMDYFGGAYWNGFLRPLWFMEENWHCIAAAAALDQHPHDAYERFCFDYVQFKGRLIHEGADDAPEDFVGGYGFGNIVPPHNTATAGFGVALAAAIEVKRARGMDVRRDEERLVRVLRFLLQNQWPAGTCFACDRKLNVAGGFSEHMASPRIRIDYVQHAWAALGHGAHALGLSSR
jgi:hypothetical protein